MTYEDPNTLIPKKPAGMILEGTSPPTGDVLPGRTYPPPPTATAGDPFEAMGGGVRLPGGEWVPKDHPLAQQAAPAPAAPAPPGAAPAAPTAPAAPGQPTTIADAFKKSLIDTLNTGGQVPTLNDPTIKAQSDAFAVGQQRAKERARASMAERAAAQGGVGVNSGAFDQGLIGLEQAQGEAEAGNNARLLGSELQQRRAQLLQAASIAGNTLNAEQARDLQRQLAELDAAIRREGIAQQSSLGQGDLALRGRLGEGQLNLGLLSALLGSDFNNRSLAQQGAQFGQGLDTQSILALLGGL